MIFVTHRYRVREVLLSSAVLGGATVAPPDVTSDGGTVMRGIARSASSPASLAHLRVLAQPAPTLGSRVELPSTGR